MSRVNIYTRDFDEFGEPTWERVGSFDPSRAVVEIDENRRWNGANLAGVHASEWEHETLYRTRRGRWIKLHWSQRVGTQPRYILLSDAEALEWLRVDESEAANEIIERYFPGDEDDIDARSPGRPEVGPQISIRVPEPMLGRLTELAAEQGTTRSELIRKILSDAVSTAAAVQSDS